MKNYQFTYLIEPSINPFCKKVKEPTKKWLEKFSIYTSRSPFIVDCAAFCFPHISFQNLQLTSDIFSLIFVFDDYIEKISFEESKAMRDIFLKVIDKEELILDENKKENKYFSALSDIINRFEVIGNELQIERFKSSLKAYVSGISKEANFLNKSLPTEKEYLDYRSETIGTYIVISLLETFYNIPSEIITNQNFKQFINYSAIHSSLVNDLLSSDGEKFLGTPNYVSIIINKNKTNEEKAKDYTFEKIEFYSSQLQKSHLHLKNELSDNKFINCLEDVMNFTFGWAK